MLVSHPTAPRSLVGSETVLVVEDQTEVRLLIDESLRRYGYTVLQARDGAEALRVCERYQDPIHLLVTDVVMPQISGRELAERIVSMRPQIQVLYVSGYTNNVITHHGILTPGTAFLQKPFTPDALAGKIRELLEAP